MASLDDMLKNIDTVWDPSANTLDENLVKRVMESSVKDLYKWLCDPSVHESVEEYYVYKYHLAPGLVAKDIDLWHDTSSELLALQLVRQYTNIPVPKVYRTFIIDDEAVLEEEDSEEEGSDSEGEAAPSMYIIMDHIPGRPLSTLWPNMSDDQKHHVARVLAGYVRQLRDIRDPRSSIPGPLAPGTEARMCDSPVFESGIIDTRGPFASYDELTEFLNERQRLTITAAPTIFSKGRPALHEPVDNSLPLVMTHQGFKLDKIILGDDGHLYLDDWSLAGFYPMWFEYVGMWAYANQNRQWRDRAMDGFNGSDELWEEIMLEICGDFKSYLDWWLKMSWTFVYR